MQYIALHHTASKNTGSPQLWAVNRYHKNKWGMKSSLGWYVGYNYFCDVDGTVTKTRAHNEEQVAQKGHNCDVQQRCDTTSFCMAGDFRYQQPTAKQEQAFQEFVDKVRKDYSNIKVVGHGDLQDGRTCPHLSRDYIDRFNRKLDAEDSVKNDELVSKRTDILRQLIRKLQALIKFYA